MGLKQTVTARRKGGCGSLALEHAKIVKRGGLHHQGGEKRGVTPEEVYASRRVSGGSNVNPGDWLQSELPHLLDEICAMAASVQQNYKKEHPGMQDNTEKDGGGPPGTLGSGAPGEGIQLSRAEAKQAWLAAGGDTEKAVRQLLRDRQAKVGCSL